MIDAAIDAGAKRIVWSGLQSPATASNGRYTKVDHFEGKWLVTLYGRARTAGTDVAFINVDAGHYAQNFRGDVGPLMAPQSKGNGLYAIQMTTSSEARFPVIDMEQDYGLFVRLAIESDEYAKGGEILTASEVISMHDLAAQLAEVSGKNVVFEQETEEVFVTRMMSTGWGSRRDAEELMEGFLAVHDVGYYGGKDVVDFRKLARPPRPWKEFAAANLDTWNKLMP